MLRDCTNIVYVIPTYIVFIAKKYRKNYQQNPIKL